jgi:multicomponent Na+:H+ antiporter subunit F
MLNTILTIAAILIMAAILITLYRFIKGPDLADRLISFDVMTISSLSLMGIIAHYAERMIYLDVILVYGLLSFLGVIIIGRYIEKGL